MDDSAEFYETHTGIISGTRNVPDGSRKESIEAARAAEDRIAEVYRERGKHPREVPSGT